MNTPMLAVGIMIVRPNQSLLLGQRIKPNERHSWGFPGGKVEKNETFQQAAIREMAEETGLQVINPLRSLTRLYTQTATSSMILSGFRMCLINDQINPINLEPDKCSGWKWFFIHQLPTPLFPASLALLNLWLCKPLPKGWSIYS